MYELIIYAVLGIALLADLKTNKLIGGKIERIIYCLIALFFVLRFNLGPDSGVYAQLFNRVVDPFRESLTSHMGRNFLYTLLSFSVKQIFGEYRWLVLIQNILILGGCSYIIWRFSKNRLFSLLLFIGSGMLEVFYGSGVRQGLAMTIYFLSFYLFLPQKKFFLYEIGCLVAFGFQEIALVVMPLPLLLLLVPSFKKHPFRVIFISFLISLITLCFVKAMLSDIAWAIIRAYGPAPTWTHVIDYLRDQRFSILGIGMETVFLLGFVIIYYCADKSGFCDFTLFSALVFLFSVFFYYSFACYDLMSRVSDFIQIIILVLIPELVAAIPDFRRKCLCFLGVFVLNGILLYADISASLRRISNMYGKEYTLESYPYILVTDLDSIRPIQAILDEE